MNKWLEILIGLILVLVPVYIVFSGSFSTWTEATWTVLKGGIIWGVFLLGILFVMLGISDLKE